MSIYIDKKYASMLSPSLPLFKWTGDNVANFRCPICGDSDKSKIKKRGYFFPIRKHDLLQFQCKNCWESKPFGMFLKEQDSSLYKEYIFETFKFNNDHKWYAKRAEDKNEKVEELLKLESFHDDPIQHLTKIRDLDEDHPCYQYALSRKLPYKYWSELYYTDNYKKWINTYVCANKFDNDKYDDPRLVIPFVNTKNKIFAYQGRSILPDDSPYMIRYITVKKHEESLLIYGMNHIDKNAESIYVLEGPLDSLFIPNATAAAGSSLMKMIKSGMKKGVYVFDNEPRNKEIVKLMEDVINSKQKIVIWPESVKEKDVNKMIQNGYTSNEILDIIKKNTYNNTLTAMLEFKKWKKV